MKHSTRIALVLLTLILAALVAQQLIACGEQPVASLAGIAVDRCRRQDITLSFDGPVTKDGKRTFVTIDREDGRRLYEALRDRYEGGERKSE